MTVVARFIVVRNGVELDEVFSVKKEAEAFDKMLDAADNLAGLIKEGGVDLNIDAPTIDAIAIFLAKNGPKVTDILRGIKPVAPSARQPEAAASEPPAAVQAIRKKTGRPPKGKKA